MHLTNFRRYFYVEMGFLRGEEGRAVHINPHSIRFHIYLREAFVFGGRTGTPVLSQKAAPSVGRA